MLRTRMRFVVFRDVFPGRYSEFGRSLLGNNSVYSFNTVSQYTIDLNASPSETQSGLTLS